jgi:DedD protein
MDEALKARLIGAAVLVALAVLLIPELLSGRKPAGSDTGAPAASRGTRTFTIELGAGAPGQTLAPATRPAVAAAAGVAPDRPPGKSPVGAPGTPATGGSAGGSRTSGTTAPVPAPIPTRAPSSLPAPSAAQASHAPLPPPAVAPPPPTVQAQASGAARGGWVVQVGAFSSAATAQKMVDQLRAAGYKAYVSPVTRSGRTLQRVRVGPEAERARADGLAATLKGRGLPATVVAND